MQSVFAPTRRRAVQAFRLTLMAALLGVSNLRLNGSIEMSDELLAVAGGDRSFKSKIQSNVITGRCALLVGSFHGKA
jgi:hypothetical protein